MKNNQTESPLIKFPEAFGIFENPKPDKTVGNSIQKSVKKDYSHLSFKKQKSKLKKWIINYPSITKMLKNSASVEQICIQLCVDELTVKKVMRAEQMIYLFDLQIKSQRIIDNNPDVIQMLNDKMSFIEIEKETGITRQTISKWSKILEDAKNHPINDLLAFEDIDESTKLYNKDIIDTPEKTEKEVKLIEKYKKRYPSIVDDALSGMIAEDLYRKYKASNNNPEGQIGKNNAKLLVRALKQDVKLKTIVPKKLSPEELAHYYITHVEIPIKYYDLADYFSPWYYNRYNLEGTDLYIENAQDMYDESYGYDRDEDDWPSSIDNEDGIDEWAGKTAFERYDLCLRDNIYVIYDDDTPQDQVEYLLKLQEQGLKLKYLSAKERKAQEENEKKEEEIKKASLDEFGNTTDHLSPFDSGRPTELNKQFVITQRKIGYWVELTFKKRIATLPEKYFTRTKKGIDQAIKNIKEELISIYNKTVRKSSLSADSVVKHVIEDYIYEVLTPLTESILKLEKRVIDEWVEGKLEIYHFAYLTEQRKQFSVEYVNAEDIMKNEIDKLKPYLKRYKKPVEFKKWLDAKGDQSFYTDIEAKLLNDKKFKNDHFEFASFPPVNCVIILWTTHIKKSIEKAKKVLHKKYPELQFIIEKKVSKEALERQAKRKERAKRFANNKESSIQKTEETDEEKKKRNIELEVLKQSLGSDKFWNLDEISWQFLNNSFNFYQDCWDENHPSALKNKEILPEAFTLEFQEIRSLLMIIGFKYIKFFTPQYLKESESLFYINNFDLGKSQANVNSFIRAIEWCYTKLPLPNHFHPPTRLRF